MASAPTCGPFRAWPPSSSASWVSGIHPGHVWKVLGAMNWISQKPEQEAKERSADAVEYGKKVRWPEVKNCAAACLVPSCRS
jgi:hypothetical protein